MSAWRLGASAGALVACAVPPGTDARDAQVNLADVSVTMPPCGTDRILASLTADYTSGAIVAVGAASGCVSPPLAITGGDDLLAWHGRALVGLEYGGNAGGSSLTYVDVDRGMVESQFNPACGGEPQWDPRAYLQLDEAHGLVAGFGGTKLAVIDRTTGIADCRVDLAPFRGGAPLPHPIALARVGNAIWVMLQRLPADLRHPQFPGAVVRLDPADLHPLDAHAIDLAHTNPVAPFAVRGDRVYVACPGSYSDGTDGAVEQRDLSGGYVRDVVRESDVHGNLDLVMPLDDDRLLLRVSTPESDDPQAVVSSVKLVVWSVGEQRQTATWIEAPGYSLVNAVLGRDGSVYVADRGYLGSPVRPFGIWRFDARTGAHDATPIATPIEPYSLAVEPAR